MLKDFVCQYRLCLKPFKSKTKGRKFCCHECYVSYEKEITPDYRFKKGEKHGRPFEEGHVPEHSLPLYSIRLRKRKKKDEYPRRYIKISEKPVQWIILALYNWQLVNGEIPRGYVLNYKDGDTFNDEIDNLEILTKKEWCDKHVGYNSKKLPQTSE